MARMSQPVCLESCDQPLARTIGQDSFLGSLTLRTEPSP